MGGALYILRMAYMMSADDAIDKTMLELKLASTTRRRQFSVDLRIQGMGWGGENLDAFIGWQRFLCHFGRTLKLVVCGSITRPGTMLFAR